MQFTYVDCYCIKIVVKLAFNDCKLVKYDT